MPLNHVTFPIDAATLTPHARPMLAIDWVHSSEGGSGQASFTAKTDAWYMQPDGTWDEVSGIELISQAAAAISGLTLAGNTTRPPVCFLAEIRKYQVHGDVCAGDELIVDIIKDAEFGGFFVTRGILRSNDATLATAELTFWRDDREKSPQTAGA